jgi:hypothetical protein
MNSAERDGELPDDLLAPEGEGDESAADADDPPGIEGEEHLGLTPPD